MGILFYLLTLFFIINYYADSIAGLPRMYNHTIYSYLKGGVVKKSHCYWDLSTKAQICQSSGSMDHKQYIATGQSKKKLHKNGHQTYDFSGIETQTSSVKPRIITTAPRGSQLPTS